MNEKIQNSLREQLTQSIKNYNQVVEIITNEQKTLGRNLTLEQVYQHYKELTDLNIRVIEMNLRIIAEMIE
nr:hypothetical protein A5881_002376 [Enterococcus termitis]